MSGAIDAAAIGGADPGAWMRIDGTWSLAIAAVPGQALLHVVVEHADAAPDGTHPPVACAGLEDVATATLGRTMLLSGRLPRIPATDVRLHASADVRLHASADVRLHARAAPRSTLWRWTAEAAPARRMRPLCRSLDAHAGRPARRPDPAQAREALRRGDLDGALDQFARACLAGYDAVACEIARAIMEFAAIHPFARTPKLGALPAALLGKVDA